MTNRLDHTATFRTLQEIFAVPFLYAAQNAAGLGDLFKPAIQLSAPSFTTNRLLQFTANGIVAGKTNLIQAAANFSGTNPVAWLNLLRRRWKRARSPRRRARPPAATDAWRAWVVGWWRVVRLRLALAAC